MKLRIPLLSYIFAFAAAFTTWSDDVDLELVGRIEQSAVRLY